MQLSRLVHHKLGFEVNPHLFRHMVHLIVLNRFPGAYAMVARVLTHRALETTIRNYSYLDGEISMRVYQDLVMDVQKGGARKRGAGSESIAYSTSDRDFRHDRKW